MSDRAHICLHASLEQQRHVQHRQQLAAGCQATQPGAALLGDQRVHSSLHPPQCCLGVMQLKRFIQANSKRTAELRLYLIIS